METIVALITAEVKSSRVLRDQNVNGVLVRKIPSTHVVNYTTDAVVIQIPEAKVATRKFYPVSTMSSVREFNAN
jgi:hypothetical protein